MTKTELRNEFVFKKQHQEGKVYNMADAMEYAYNLAIDHAAENALTYSDGVDRFVDKESILNLKITE